MDANSRFVLLRTTSLVSAFADLRVSQQEKDTLFSTAETMYATAAVVERWFTPAFAERAPQQIEIARRMLLHTSPAGYVANCAAVRDMDQRDGLGAIRVPTLVIAGSQDKATPAADGQFLAGQIPGARYLELETSHLSNWEQPEQFTAAVVDFLTA